jgi:hypothetical protein
MLTRREMLSKLALGAAALAGGAVPLGMGEFSARESGMFSSGDDDFLEELERADFSLFWENAHPETGLIKNYVRTLRNDVSNSSSAVSSIAATGFGLTGLCIADRRGWLAPGEALERVRVTLKFLLNRLQCEHGFFFHFVDRATGKRALKCEISSIDTAILLCGVLTCRQYFRDDEVSRFAGEIYDRVDWQWMLQDGPFLRHGWTPESGFLAPCWDTYCEHMMLYLLAIGSSRHPIPAETWDAWQRPQTEFAGNRYIGAEAPLFIHQYSHAWFDFRGRHDSYADYFENSAAATRAHRQFCADLSGEFPHFSQELWGITASDSPQGYVIWGGPPRQGPIDGTVVPCAAGGSLPFLPQECVRVLRKIRDHYGQAIWQRYGFVDAFNPATGWTAPDLVSINTGITLLMAENARTGFVWDTFMKNEEARAAMEKAGFSPSTRR